MRIVENECVGCPPELGCLGNSCPKRRVVRFCCDSCYEEDELYYFDNKELCVSCILKRLHKVNDWEY